MKKLLLMMMILFFSIDSPNAEHRFGVRYGGGLSSMFEQEISTPNKSSMVISALGGHYRIALNEMFSIQIEALLTGKGARFSNEDYLSTGGRRESIRLNYLEFPVLARFSIPVRDFRPQFFFGPSMSLLLSYMHVVEEQFQRVSTEFIGDMLPYDLGLTVGGALGVEAEAGIFMLEFRYTIGFTESPLSYLDNQQRTKNRVFHLLIAYDFKLSSE